ncbi:YncE family protein [Streptomyces kaniharaensis]|uniref:YncE family protein n=1 Tax=Streptomyces kaniharaensis TaxID=212423 RepID=A0A6N7KKV8_9ACTN|nr:YncE family protein [Streptomyces kaniharaensis]MQS11189.1 YncE family protein [Streptomyces kaniharaensis]
MSTYTRVKAARWTAVIAAAAALALTGTTAQAVEAVSGTEGVIAVGKMNAQPSVSPDGTKAYVVVAEADNTLVVKTVDTQTGAVTGRVALGATQFYVASALSPDGSRLYVVNQQQFTVVDTATLKVLTTAALPDQSRPAGWNPGTPTGVTVSPDGATVYVAQNGATAYRQNGNGRVVAFSAAQRAFTGSVEVPAVYTGNLAIRPNGQDAYLGSVAGVFHLKTTGAAPTLVAAVPGTAAALDYSVALTPDGTRLFALGGGAAGAGQADLVDPATDTVTKHVALVSGYADLSNPQASPDGTRFYVSQNSYTTGPSVLSVDSATGATVAAETVSTTVEHVDHLAVGPDSHTLYVGGTIGNAADLEIDNN